MAEINGIVVPCFGTLEEIHAALIKDLNWENEQVTINGDGFTVLSAGFQRNASGICRLPCQWEKIHTGTAILVGTMDIIENAILYEIITSGKIPHISKRCALCGSQLDQSSIRRGACGPCYAREVGG